MRREARENWLRLRQHRIEGTKGVNHAKDAGSEADPLVASRNPRAAAAQRARVSGSAAACACISFA